MLNEKTKGRRLTSDYGHSYQSRNTDLEIKARECDSLHAYIYGLPVLGEGFWE